MAYMRFLPDQGDNSPSLHHHQILKNVTRRSRLAMKSRIRSHERSFNGFAVNLSQEEKQKLADNRLVEKKVVLCDNSNHVDSVRAAGAIGCILPNHGNNYSEVGPLPVAALNASDINVVKTYHRSTREPRVQILKSEAIYKPTPLVVASFSSRGPSQFLSDIIKPDVTAVEILAAYSLLASPSETFMDKSSNKYKILSGTSIACPHVVDGAYVKSFHPDWSPSAIKSALMTTVSAWEMDASKSLDEAEFAYGSGHIYPLKAKDPGLMYDTSVQYYLQIWCNISNASNNSCSNLTLRELNYPSMAARVDRKSAFEVSFPRTVTNVGDANSKYVASIQGSSKFHITVDPDHLHFTAINQKMSFVVTVRGKGPRSPLTRISVSLLWNDNNHKVRSPLVVYTGNSTTSLASRFCKSFVMILTLFALLL